MVFSLKWLSRKSTEALFHDKYKRLDFLITSESRVKLASKMFPALWLVLFVFICRLVNVSAHNKSLEIYPKQAALKPEGNLNVTCTNAADLYQCQFWLRYQNTTLMTVQDGPVFYVASNKNRTVMKNYPRSLTAAPYDAVVELQGKECRLQLRNVSEGRYLVGCRIKLASYNSVEEKYMGLYVKEEADEFESNKTDINVIQEVAYGDDNAEIVFELEDSNYFTELCKLDGLQNVTLRKDHSPSLNKKKTKCTLPIVANDAAKGPVWITAKTTSEGITVTRHYMGIIVVKKPHRMTLSSWLLPHNDGPEEEILLTAICGVYESEHRIDISWTLTNGTETYFPTHTSVIRSNRGQWTWPWVKKSSQATLATTIPPSDIGKTLTCEIEFLDTFWNTLLTTKKEIVLTPNGKSMTQAFQRPETEELTPRAPSTTDTTVIMLIALSVSHFVAVVIAIVATTAYLRAARMYCFKPAIAEGPHELAVQFQKDSQNTGSVALYNDVNLQLHN